MFWKYLEVHWNFSNGSEFLSISNTVNFCTVPYSYLKKIVSPYFKWCKKTSWEVILTQGAKKTYSEMSLSDRRKISKTVYSQWITLILSHKMPTLFRIKCKTTQRQTRTLNYISGVEIFMRPLVCPSDDCLLCGWNCVVVFKEDHISHFQVSMIRDLNTMKYTNAEHFYELDVVLSFAVVVGFSLPFFLRFGIISSEAVFV